MCLCHLQLLFVEKTNKVTRMIIAKDDTIVQTITLRKV